MFLGSEYPLSVCIVMFYLSTFCVLPLLHCQEVRWALEAWASSSAMGFRWWGLAIRDSWWWPLIIAVCFCCLVIVGQCSMLWIPWMANAFKVSPSRALQSVLWLLLELKFAFLRWSFFGEFQWVNVYVERWWTLVVYVSMSGLHCEPAKDHTIAYQNQTAKAAPVPSARPPAPLAERPPLRALELPVPNLKSLTSSFLASHAI